MDLQNRIENYWQNRSTSYNKIIQEEMSSHTKDAWTELINEYRPAGKSLQVLDIGTGPGFFVLLLSGMGHRVAAIDCSDNMLAVARENVLRAGFQAEFYNMDSHELIFVDETFDLLICRNLTWTLREPQRAYREWHRILKPGGRLLIFDANWHLRLFDPEVDRQHREDLERARQMGIPDPHANIDKEESDDISRNLYLSNRLRPQWDVGALMDCGFGKIFIEADISDRVWDERYKVMYRTTPMFMVAAEKKI
ncbi:MAG: class I SAM-dependent methyltransferase [Bacillota bacterium]|jgi:ubiquinone/menaquinone biosynthesis C-methylase UbiE